MFAFRSVVVAFAFTLAACAAETEPMSSANTNGLVIDA